MIKGERHYYKIIKTSPTFRGLKLNVLSLEVSDLMSTAETVDSRSFLSALLIFLSDIAHGVLKG